MQVQGAKGGRVAMPFTHAAAAPGRCFPFFAEKLQTRVLRGSAPSKSRGGRQARDAPRLLTTYLPTYLHAYTHRGICRGQMRSFCGMMTKDDIWPSLSAAFLQAACGLSN